MEGRGATVDLLVGDRLGAVQRAVELDRAARRVRTGRVLGDGLPLAVQLVGRPHDEDDAALARRAARGGRPTWATAARRSRSVSPGPGR